MIQTRPNYRHQLAQLDKVAEALRLNYTTSRSELREAALRFMDGLGLDSVDLVDIVDIRFDSTQVGA